MSLAPGAVIGGRYRLVGLVATGGMGEVWRAQDTRLERVVAVKLLKSEISAEREFLERFRVEARITASLNHPGIAAVYDYGETTDDAGRHVAYLVMELVAGESLSSALARLGRVSVSRTVDMLEQTGHALQAAHERGLVHRDVKPGNILITPTGGVKITDFGIAKATDAAPVTRTGTVMGTAQYLAPEQALGRDASPASDIYSLGVVGYESITGSRPFEGDSAVGVAMMHVQRQPPPLPESVPAPVRELIGYALAKDPALRYPDGGSFAAAAAAVRAGRRPPPPVGHRAAAASATARVASSSGATMPANGAAATRVLPAASSSGAASSRAAAPADSRSRGGGATGTKVALWLLSLALLGVLVSVGYVLASANNNDSVPPQVAPSGSPTPPPVPSPSPQISVVTSISVVTTSVTPSPTSSSAPTSPSIPTSNSSHSSPSEDQSSLGTTAPATDGSGEPSPATPTITPGQGWPGGWP